MSEFPSAQRIIEELAATEPYIKDGGKSRQGEVAAAEWLYEFANRWELGNVTRNYIPKSHKFEAYASQEPKLHNIIIDTDNGGNPEETLFLHGHFDAVSPDDYNGQSHSIRQDLQEAHFLTGLQSYDMLAGIAGILKALHKIRVSKRRRVRTVLVFGEENDSEGTHTAFDPQANVFAFDGHRSAISTEITVNARITDPYHLVIGRPGRVALRTEISGKVMHAGSVTQEDKPLLLSARMRKAMLLLDELDAGNDFDHHPYDKEKLMAAVRCCIGDIFSLKESRSLSTNGKGTIDVNLHYAHPEQGVSYITSLIDRKIFEIFGDLHYRVAPEKRGVPWSEPWFEDPQSPFVKNMRFFAGKAANYEVGLRCGGGVADENILHKNNIPTVCIPPKGEFEHTRKERVDVNSITDYIAPTIREAAAYDGILTEK